MVNQYRKGGIILMVRRAMSLIEDGVFHGAIAVVILTDSLPMTGCDADVFCLPMSQRDNPTP